MKPTNYKAIKKAFDATLIDLQIDTYDQEFTDEVILGVIESMGAVPMNLEMTKDAKEAYLFGARLAIEARQFLEFADQKEELFNKHFKKSA